MKSFELDIPAIDRDHRDLIVLVQSIDAAVEAVELDHCETLIEQALVLAEKHFRHEERLLEKWGYPNAASHAEYHRELQRRAEEIRDACRLSQHPKALEDCYKRLLSFIVDDVIRGDMKFKSYLQHAGKTGPWDVPDQTY